MKDWISSKKTLIATNIVLVAVIIFIVFFPCKDSHREIGAVMRDQDNEYKFTNPILDYENLSSGEETVIPVGAVNKKVKEVQERDDINEISLYYRDMNNGQWIGVDEKDEFSPASLLKVPTMMAFLKSIESAPETLSKEIIIPDIRNPKVEQNIRFDGTINPGERHTYLETLASMIVKSDNVAAQTILSATDPKQIEKVFYSVGVPFTDTETEPILRVKDYAGFFRVLYNASYLNREMSELALEILSSTEYKDGIVAGVPSDIVVAHKFGERSLLDKSDGATIKGQTQIHDCGIVYLPEDPYLLCIMTKGDDFVAQEKVIQELSRFIYVELRK